MNPTHKVMLLAVVLSLLVSCRPTPTPTPRPPTPTPMPTATPLPPTPTLKVWPTSSTPAPEIPVIPVGYTATFRDTQHGVSGKAVMAGLQTIVINGFDYDGEGSAADIRLVKEGDWDNAVAILIELETRSYKEELLVMTVPSDLQPLEADSIAVYCPETKTLYGWARFE